MRLYFAGPLFTTAERAWNAEVTSALRAAGFEVLSRIDVPLAPEQPRTGDEA